MPERYRVILDAHATRQLRRIRGADRSKIRALVAELASDPRPRRVLKLRGNLYRVRRGNWRIAYEIDDNARLITITDVLRRNERTYRDL